MPGDVTDDNLKESLINFPGTLLIKRHGKGKTMRVKSHFLETAMVLIQDLKNNQKTNWKTYENSKRSLKKTGIVKE